MKRWLPEGKLLYIITLSILFSSCFKDKISQQYTLMKPIYGSKASVLAAIGSNEVRQMESPGKIFVLGRYLFVNELNKGVHIIDNIDPAQPKRVAFIDIPGNVDIAVKGTTLYADMYKDLLVIDVTNPLDVKLVKDIPGVFPERVYGTNFIDSSEIIVRWEIKDTVVMVEKRDINWEAYGYMAMSGDASMSKRAYVPGIAGSMARFSLVNDYLYTINMSALYSFDISNPHDPQQRSVSYVGWNIETLYPFDNKLFIGSTTGMFIYELNDPANPAAAGTFSHARACDPVVADGDYAFVTLKTGDACAGNSNQLDVIDVTNINSPQLIKTYPMTNPGGLAKDGNRIFICDGTDGLKMYDATDVRNLKLLEQLTNVEPYDVIAWDNWLVMVGSEGIYQYDYSDGLHLKQLSVMHTQRTK
jgi:hypothetical protein